MERRKLLISSKVNFFLQFLSDSSIRMETSNNEKKDKKGQELTEMIIILLMVKQKQYNTMARPQEQSHEHYRILSVQKEEKREYAKSR